MSGVDQPLRLHLLPSYRLAALIAGLHLIAAGCIYAVGWGIAGTVLAVFVAALGVAAAWDRALLRTSRSPRALELSDGGLSQVEFSPGTRWPVADGRRSVNRFWVTLPLRGPFRRAVIVSADMLGPERFRLLRLWALWGRLPGVASGQPPA